MQKYILNTNALAQGKEDALLKYPEREKEPYYFYTTGEEKKDTIYATVNTQNGVIVELYGLETTQNLRGFHLKVTIGFETTKLINVRTNYDTLLNGRLLQKVWSGGPFSLLKAIVVLEETLDSKKHPHWLRAYLLGGGIGLIPDKRIKYEQFINSYQVLFK